MLRNMQASRELPLSWKQRMPISPRKQYVLVKIIKTFVSLAAKSEVACLFMNALHAVAIQLALKDMEHPYPPTPLRTDTIPLQGILLGVFK